MRYIFGYLCFFLAFPLFAVTTVTTTHNGESVYVAYEGTYPETFDIVFEGPSLWAGSKSSAQQCASGFAGFLSTYDWPEGRPDVLPWASPVVYECTWTSDNSTYKYWRIVFGDSSVAGTPDYITCLNAYSQGCGGTGGYGMFALCVPNAFKLSDGIQSASTLNGYSLAQDMDLSEVRLQTRDGDITFVQNTVSDVTAENLYGEAQVDSQASASEDGTNIYITNNTDVTTNLELGDAPDPDSYVNTEDGGEKEVSDSNGLLDKTEPEYTYINTASSEYSIDYNKLYEDVNERMTEIFGYEGISDIFDRTVTSQSMTDWSFHWVDPLVRCSWAFNLPWSSIVTNDVVTSLRLLIGFFCVWETVVMSIRLFA